MMMVILSSQEYKKNEGFYYPTTDLSDVQPQPEFLSQILLVMVQTR